MGKLVEIMSLMAVSDDIIAWTWLWWGWEGVAGGRYGGEDLLERGSPLP